jgi:hypothetical protein
LACRDLSRTGPSRDYMHSTTHVKRSTKSVLFIYIYNTDVYIIHNIHSREKKIIRRPMGSGAGIKRRSVMSYFLRPDKVFLGP